MLLDEGQSLRRVADGPRISVVVRDGVVLVGEGVVAPLEGEVSEAFDFDSDAEVSEGVDFDSEGEVTASEAVGDEPALSAL